MIWLNVPPSVKKTNKMKSHAVLMAVVVMASIAVDDAAAGYGRLNAYLVENVPDDEIDSNLEAASKWLKEQTNTIMPFLSMVPIRDLKKFTALRDVIDQFKCDHESYEIMRANLKASGLNGEVIRRVDKVILKIFQAQAQRCSRVYQTIYESKREKLDELALQRVDRLGKIIVDADLVSPKSSYLGIYSWNLYDEYVKHRVELKTFTNIGFALHGALSAISRDDPDTMYLKKIPNEHTGKREVHEDKIKLLARKYLLEPCKQYEAEMGPDLFIPAEFDTQVYDTVLENSLNYYLGWSYFKICHALTSNESGVFNEIVKITKNHY